MTATQSTRFLQTDTKVAKDWAEKLLHEYENGASDVEVCSELGISQATFNENYETNAVFHQLVDIGRLKSQAFWNRMARNNLYNRAFNAPLWMFVMKNRFGWAEKQEVTGANTPMSQQNIDELQMKVVAKLPGLMKKLGINMPEGKLLEKTSEEKPLDE